MPDETKILVYVVDDDIFVRQALEMLFISADMKVMTFESAEVFLKCKLREKKTCLITDTKMKGLSGLELQQKLTERGIKMPVVFLTTFDSNESRQRVKQAGAVGYLQKPVDDQALLDTIKWALSNDS